MPRLAIAVLLLTAACHQPNPASCDDYCGEGTRCVDAKCVVATVEAEVAEPEPKKNKGKRRRRRGRGRKDGTPAKSGFVPMNDKSVPRYNNSRGQSITDASGSERLSDRRVRRHMRGLEGRFNACIATAAQHSSTDLGRGGISFDINVEPSGKVTGVSVQAPKHLRVFGIVPCLRLGVHRSRFPTWNGPAMRVEYSFKIG